MCGIVGLFLKDRALEPELGALLASMLGTMRDRGPDSAGFAVYGAATPGAIKLTVRAPRDCDFAALVRRVEAGRTPLPHVVHDTHLVLTVRSADEAAIRAEIAAMSELTVIGSRRRMAIFKEVGRPTKVAERFGLDSMGGSYSIGHTRFFFNDTATT